MEASPLGPARVPEAVAERGGCGRAPPAPFFAPGRRRRRRGEAGHPPSAGAAPAPAPASPGGLSRGRRGSAPVGGSWSRAGPRALPASPGRRGGGVRLSELREKALLALRPVTSYFVTSHRSRGEAEVTARRNGRSAAPVSEKFVGLVCLFVCFSSLSGGLSARFC